MLYGHRRDVAGYAHALEQFDARLPEFEACLRPGDLAVITADHGCDPTGQVQIIHVSIFRCWLLGRGLPSGSVGKRETFADIGQSIAKHLRLNPLKVGTAFL